MEILCGSGRNHCLLGLYYCPVFPVSRAKLLKNVLHKEIHSGVALSNLNESSTVLFRQPRQTEELSFIMSLYNPLTCGQ